MDELLYAAYGNPLLLKRFEYERFDSLGWVARRGERFADHETAASSIEHDKVREGTANIRPYPTLSGGTFHQSISPFTATIFSVTRCCSNLLSLLSGIY